METIKQKKLPKLTKKQRGFVEDYVLTGNGQKAALNNYDIEAKDPESVARSIASENLTKPNVALAVEIQTETLKSALQNQKVTPEKIAKKIDSLLENSDPNAIDKGLKHAINIYGIEDLNEKPKTNTTYNFIFNAETQEKVREIEATIKAQLIKPHVESI